MIKAILLVLDGVPDRPVSALGGRTPLQAARTPNLDRLAARGLNGLMDVLAPGVALSTELAHLLLFGYSVEDFPGRGMIEALGDGFAFDDEDVLFSTSFATAADEGEGFAIVERKHGLKEEEWRELAGALRPFEAEGIRIEFLYSGQGYGHLKLSGGASERVSDADPFYPGLPVSEVQPREGYEKDPATQATCAALNAYLLWAHHELEASALNARRRKEGLKPVNFLLVKWAGRSRSLVPFEERWVMRGVSVGSSSVLKGTALAAGLDFEHVPKAEDPEVDFRERLRRASDLLADYDFVHIHTKAADDAAHTGRAGEKVQVISALDRALDVLEGEEFAQRDLLLVVTSDHATPSEGALIHGGDPVPITLVGRRVVPDSVSAYSEQAALAGGLGRIRGKDLLPLILNYTDRAAIYLWQPSPRHSLAIPRRVLPLKRR